MRLIPDRRVGEGDKPIPYGTTRFIAPVNFSQPVSLPPSTFVRASAL